MTTLSSIVPGFTSGGLTWSLISTNTTAEVNHGYLINATSGNVELQLPATPTEGDTVGVCDAYNQATTNTITVTRNGSNIQGLAEDMVINIAGAGFTLVYVDATKGWKIVDEIGVNGSTYTADRALITSSSGAIIVSAVTSTEVGYLSGVSGVGITDDNLVLIDQADAASGEIVRATANGIETRSNAEVKTQLGIDYQTLYIDAGAMVPCTTNGAASSTEEYGTNDIDVDILAFDAGATEERAQFKLVMPENWDRSTVKVKFYWGNASGASASDTVEWAIKAGALGNDDAIDAALGTAVTISDTVIADGDLHVTSVTGALTIGGTPALGDLIEFEVYRNTDGTDDMAEDAWLLGVLIQYKVDQTVSAW
jgi:hypothetical protein